MLKTERTDGVAVMTMDNKQNQVSGPFCDAVRKELKELASDRSVRAVVIAGGDKFFCNGLDLAWMKGQGPQELYAFLLNVSGLLKDTALYPKPLIGAITGHAFGLGAIWASGFDFRFTRTDRGWVCFPEMDINIPFSPGMIAICEHGLGKRVFREMAFSAKRYTGEEAVAVGWAVAHAPGEELVGVAKEKAAFMAKKGFAAFSITKQTWASAVVKAIDELDPEAYKKIPLKM
jgi:Delta3-Delta2-enoyl-CoA isomerase